MRNLTINEKKVAAYLVAKTELAFDKAQGKLVPFEVKGANYGECMEWTGLSMEQVEAAYQSLQVLSLEATHARGVEVSTVE